MIDATLGEGGHSELFLETFPQLRITGVDADGAILQAARTRLERFGRRIQFYAGWSEDFFNQICAARSTAGRGDSASTRGAPPDTVVISNGERTDDAHSSGEGPAIILIDLGVSLYHYEKGGRGFSFRKDEPLDMRIDSGRGRSAAELLASAREEELAALLWRHAEERYSRRIAAAIVAARRAAAIESSAVLAGLVEKAVPAQYRAGPSHPATKTFQALRIAVNGELDLLEARLAAAFAALAPAGRLAVISFHSLEDRIVKNFFRGTAKACVCPPQAPICKCGGKVRARLLTKKPVAAAGEEVRRNPPSRGAKLRVIEKLLWED